MGKIIDKQKQGKNNRNRGRAFERKVRERLENLGFIVAKWTNNIDFEKNKLVHAGGKFNPFTKRLMAIGTGFPDFIIFKPGAETEIIGVECKLGKYLDKDEKKKCRWLLSKLIFKEIWIAHKKGRDYLFNRQQK